MYGSTTPPPPASVTHDRISKCKWPASFSDTATVLVKLKKKKKRIKNITLDLPWRKKRMNNLLPADVGIQGRRGQVNVANDFYTENSRRLSTLDTFQKSNYVEHLAN